MMRERRHRIDVFEDGSFAEIVDEPGHIEISIVPEEAGPAVGSLEPTQDRLDKIKKGGGFKGAAIDPETGDVLTKAEFKKLRKQ
jgi:hypothetical protein